MIEDFFEQGDILEYSFEQRDYLSKKTFPLNRKHLEHYCIDTPNISTYQGFNFYPGLSAADSENPERPRDREGFLREFLNPMIAAGKIGDGVHSKFDDRKFRFDKAKVMYSRDRGDELFIELGITHYQECADCRKRSPEEVQRLMEEGQRRFNDPHAYFTRGCGIEATPITNEGHIFVGKRKPGDNTYSGELAAVNGWVEYQGMMTKMCFQHMIDVDFRKDVLREMKEEFGILEKDVAKLIFSGIVSAQNRADTDFVYLVPLLIGDKEFLDRYKNRQDEEHEELVKIANYRDMKQLLETGELPEYKGKFSLLYSLRASLKQIEPGEMAS